MRKFQQWRDELRLALWPLLFPFYTISHFHDSSGRMLPKRKQFHKLFILLMFILKLINNSSIENKENHYCDRGLDMCS